MNLFRSLFTQILFTLRHLIILPRSLFSLPVEVYTTGSDVAGSPVGAGADVADFVPDWEVSTFGREGIHRHAADPDDFGRARPRQGY